MRGIGRRKAQRSARGPRGFAPGSPGMPPPPPPQLAVPAPAAAVADGPATFAFPEPHPDEAIGAQRPGPSRSGGEVALRDVLIALVALGVVVGTRAATGGDLSAYGLGRSFGVAFGGLLLAYGARQIYLRTSGNDGPAWGLSLIPIAVILGLAGQFTILGSVTAAPDEAAVRATLVPLEGFEYQAAPAGAVDQIEKFLAGLPEMGDKMGAVEARVVEKGSRPAGVVMVVGIRPDALREMEMADLQTGLQAASGTPVVEKKRAGVKTFELSTGPLYSIVFLDDDGYLFTVQGFQKRHSIVIAKRLAGANL